MCSALHLKSQPNLLACPRVSLSAQMERDPVELGRLFSYVVSATTMSRMDFIAVFAAVITLLGALLAFKKPNLPVVRAAGPEPKGFPYLAGLACVIIVFGVFNLWYFWNTLRDQAENAIFIVWLILAMMAGMFVKVVATNYQAGRPLFDVSGDQLVYPLLFSVMVFYPVWAVAASAPKGFFVIHSAFLNGYFWESIVSAAKPPAGANAR
jgi:hypothetical protein